MEQTAAEMMEEEIVVDGTEETQAAQATEGDERAEAHELSQMHGSQQGGDVDAPLVVPMDEAVCFDRSRADADGSADYVGRGLGAALGDEREAYV